MEQTFGPIRFVPGSNSGKYPHCHSLYIEADRKVLVDPASDRNRLIELRDGPGVDAVWLSHWHEDHFKDLDLFEEKELWISEADAPPLASLDALFDAYGMTAEERQGSEPVILKVFRFRARKPSRVFNGQGVMDLGGVKVEVIPTPGHTPGHCALLFPEHEVLFLGDYDLSKFGPWYGDRDSDIDDTIASVNHLRTITAKVWITGHEHGVYREEPGELWDRYLHVINQRDEKLLDLLKEPRSISDVVDARIIYGRKREPASFFDFGERALMGKHLERFMRKGIVVSNDSLYSLA
ncbi:MAG: MBL fold metallo-hydrolase [Desulfomonile tiedjei]|nr:MBL fold metallo-hydrolase [Desulfomonile tiedjei]